MLGASLVSRLCFVGRWSCWLLLSLACLLAASACAACDIMRAQKESAPSGWQRHGMILATSIRVVVRRKKEDYDVLVVEAELRCAAYYERIAPSKKNHDYDNTK